MGRAALAITVLTAAATLAGCSVPDFRQPGWLDRPMFERRDPAPGTATMPGNAPAASTAETACMDAGRAAGFAVQGVVGTSEVTDDAGMPVSRDVMLRATRGSQSVDVRCSYGYASAEARIMTL